MDFEIRSGTVADSADILAVMMDAFGIPQDSIRWPGLHSLAYNAPCHFRVMVSEGRVVAVLHIGDTWIQVGQCAVLKGDVGHVSVLRELQGRGLGTALMRDTVRHLREHGYHLSRLGGLMSFYSRFGYEPFARRFVDFDVEAMQGGAREIPATEVYPEPSGYQGTIRPWDEARDWQARAEIAYEFYHGRSGAERVPHPSQVSPPAQPSPVCPELMQWVYELDGVVQGYLFASDNPWESKPGLPVFSITDFAYRPQCPAAAELLVRKLLARVAHHAPARITSRLPFDEGLAITLQGAGVTFKRIELHQASAGNMIQVLNLRATLEAVLPELQARLAASPVAQWSGAIELALPAESAVLRTSGGQIGVEQGPGDARVEMTQADFVKLLFGIAGLEELPCAVQLPAAERHVLAALFPRCPTGSGPWG